MAIYTNLPIYKSAYSLLLAVNRIMPNLPRDCRYSVGVEVRNKIMEIIILVYRANRSWQKSGIIESMREILVEIQVYLRLMCDMKYVSENCYMMLAEQTVSMSKQLSAWEKSVKRNNNGDAENHS